MSVLATSSFSTLHTYTKAQCVNTTPTTAMRLTSIKKWLNRLQRKVRRNTLPSRSEWLQSLRHELPRSPRCCCDRSPDCAICYRPFTVYNPNRHRIRLACGHRDFCFECLKHWSEMGKNTCPGCRAPLWHLQLMCSRLAEGQQRTERRRGVEVGEGVWVLYLMQ